MRPTERIPLPGDELLRGARFESTHAIDIAAPPSRVWPWLVQMGRRRAGWYSWDLFENGGECSARTGRSALDEVEASPLQQQ